MPPHGKAATTSLDALTISAYWPCCKAAWAQNELVLVAVDLIYLTPKSQACRGETFTAVQLLQAELLNG
jgi:hypothetical protein